MKTSILAVLAAASFAWAGAGPAAAGNCVKNNREGEIYDPIKVRTIVKNNDKNMDYEVTISDRGTKRVDSAKLESGEKLEDNDKSDARNDPAWNMAIRVYPVDGEGWSACYYSVTGEEVCAHRESFCYSKSTWRIGGAGYVVCSGPWEVTCDKTFNSKTNRWTTTLTIKGK